MYSFRDSNQKDFDDIAAFTKDRTESFYMFPKGRFPVESKQLYEVSLTRLMPTVIEFDQQVVGYSNFYDLVEGEYCWLGNVIIHRDFRGKGAGKYLMEVMITKAREELKVKQLQLVCHNTNTKALFMYYKLGFEPFDIKLAKDYNNEDVAGIKMRTSLSKD
ncbi:Acetyltransferase (GNAT) family protein [Paenibacillus sp. 1_12]|uniref:GNAT family N-acetyltransferase n=1 Tax=Paenibacillus sp. 1_12 TaxID=1566278 RepID=UPI0008ECF527|nr:GNAT family N-acetyltransferase [Paenibacillus sp. 1_12]SFL34572.1 Acetyltransferase (GNAT) family protein [Paenibacillus sp. 1_12]